MEALITCSNNDGKNTGYVLAAVKEGRPITFTSETQLVFHAGEAVEVSGSDIVKTIPEASARIMQGLSDAVDKVADETVSEEPYSIGIRGIDEATERMWPKLSACSKVLLKKLMMSAPVIIRFHNDSDGSSGACALYKALGATLQKLDSRSEIIWIMHKGISYRGEDAESDILALNAFSSYEKPLIIMLDFGTSEESNAGIKPIGSSADIIWLDHHPLQENAECQKLKYYVNPWQFSSDSNYTAGALASVFTMTFSKEDVKEFIYSSLIGDYSDYRIAYDDAAATSTILDMITSDPGIIGSSDRISPKELFKALSGERRQELLNFAKVALNEVLDNSAKASKRYEASNGIAIYVLDFEKVKPESRYPLPGRFASKFLEQTEVSEPNGSIVIVHAGRYISIRSGVSQSIVDIKEAIAHVAEAKQGLVDSYGGHEMASSVRVVYSEAKTEVIPALVNELKKEIAQNSAKQ